MRKLFLLSVIAALGAVLVPSGQGAGGTLTGTVGPGFTISLTMNGAPVTQLDPGDYTIQVSDKADLHNFHLSGPGVNDATDVPGTGDATWNVTFVDGTYSYVCDASPTSAPATRSRSAPRQASALRRSPVAATRSRSWTSRRRTASTCRAPG